jgi:hypothetical protein
MYSHGQGVPQDYNEALRWRRKSADQGYANGEDGLGYMYLNGQGVPQDYAEALLWYRKAADQGDAHAQYNLGNMYYYGRGVPQNPVEAVRLYQKAADQGDEYAQRVLHIKWKGMSTPIKISLAVMFLGCLSVLVGPLMPGGNLQGGNRRISTLAALLGLSYVALDLLGFRYIGILTLLPAIGAFQFVKSLAAGTTVALLLSIVLPKNLWLKVAKILLELNGALLIGLELFMVWNHKLRSAVPAFRSFWSMNGMLLGMIASLAIVLWLTAKRRRDQNSVDLIAASYSSTDLNGDEP